MSTGLACPKCQSEMRSYERSGVTVDQCTNCGGIFLDRGEMERLIEAEGRFLQAAVPPAPQGGYPQGGYPQGGYAQGGGFLGSLFGYQEGHHGRRGRHH